MATGPQLDVEVTGDKLAAERITQVGDRALDVQPVRPLLDPTFRRQEETRFAINGPGWLPLKDTTVRLKEAHGWDARILRRTGELERSLTSPASGLTAELSGGPSELVFGTAVPYARFHQYGQGVPKRPVIDLSPAAVEEMTETVQTYIVEGLP